MLQGEIRFLIATKVSSDKLRGRAEFLFVRAVQACNEHAAINRLDRAGLRLVKGNGDFMNMRPDNRPVDRGHNSTAKGRPSRRCWLSIFLSPVRKT